MFILPSIIAAVVLVFLGYASLWSAYQANLPKNVSQFGKVMSIILFVTAGLVILFSLAVKHPGMGHGRMGMMNFKDNPCMSGQMGGHLRMGGMRENMGRMVPDVKGKTEETPGKDAKQEGRLPAQPKGKDVDN